MKIPKKRIFYTPAFHNAAIGEPFCIEGGGHWPTMAEALKEAKKHQEYESAKMFVAEVTIREARLPLEEVP